MKIYHNPRCRKSREALQLLQEKGMDPEIIQYLQTPPTREELKAVLKLLGIPPQQLIRKGEEVFKEQFRGKEYTDEEWIDILVSHPKLIERPIAIHKGKAVIGRPPEKVLELLD